MLQPFVSNLGQVVHTSHCDRSKAKLKFSFFTGNAHQVANRIGSAGKYEGGGRVSAKHIDL